MAFETFRGYRSHDTQAGCRHAVAGASRQAGKRHHHIVGGKIRIACIEA